MSSFERWWCADHAEPITETTRNSEIFGAAQAAWEAGHDAGYEQGHTDGYEEGYDRG